MKAAQTMKFSVLQSLHRPPKKPKRLLLNQMLLLQTLLVMTRNKLGRSRRRRSLKAALRNVKLLSELVLAYFF
jgi:hypothetical protein